MKWEENVGGKIKQIVLLPVMLVMYSFLLIMTPFIYAVHWRNVHKEKSKLRDEINRWSSEPRSFKVPDSKQLASLWAVHGLESYGYAFEIQVDLLREWLDILYGNDISDALHLRDRISEIETQQADTRIQFNKKNRQIPHVTLTPPIPTLIRRLSDELPPYETFAQL